MTKLPTAKPENPEPPPETGQPPETGSPGDTGSQKRLSKSELPRIASSILPTPLISRAGILQAEKAEVASYGGHAAWLQAKARPLLPLFPSGLSESIFESDTLVFWEDAARRIEQCKRCPPHGGECVDSHFCWADGDMIVPDQVKGIRGEQCPKWPTWRIRELLLRLNVPPHLTDPEFAVLPPVVAQALTATRQDRQPRWYYVTGGDPRRHERLLIPLLYELSLIFLRTCWFDVTASVFRRSLEHQRHSELEDPFDRLRDTHVLALNIVSPGAWKEWFVEGIDEALYARSGKTTVLAHAKPADELAEKLQLSAGLLTSAIQVELG